MITHEVFRWRPILRVRVSRLGKSEANEEIIRPQATGPQLGTEPASTVPNVWQQSDCCLPGVTHPGLVIGTGRPTIFSRLRTAAWIKVYALPSC
jgi:hypothetical protein